MSLRRGSWQWLRLWKGLTRLPASSASTSQHLQRPAMRVKMVWEATVSYQCGVCSIESQFFVELEVVPGRKLLSLQPRCLPPWTVCRSFTTISVEIFLHVTPTSTDYVMMFRAKVHDGAQRKSPKGVSMRPQCIRFKTLLVLQPSDDQQDAGSLSIDTWLLPLSSFLF